MNDVRKVGAPKPPVNREGSGVEKKPAKSFKEALQEKIHPKAPEPELAPLAFRMPEGPTVETVQRSSSPEEVAAAVQALAGELVEKVEAAGPSEVRIEFNSTVLDGLSVVAQRDGNALEVRFEAATPETAVLLAGNSPILAARLERLGYNARISVGRKRQQQQQQEQPKDRERR